jgi:hypothetical protein
LRKHRGKISPAAAELGISRPTFYENGEAGHSAGRRRRCPRGMKKPPGVPGG